MPNFFNFHRSRGKLHNTQQRHFSLLASRHILSWTNTRARNCYLRLSQVYMMRIMQGSLLSAITQESRCDCVIGLREIRGSHTHIQDTSSDKSEYTVRCRCQRAWIFPLFLYALQWKHTNKKIENNNSLFLSDDERVAGLWQWARLFSQRPSMCVCTRWPRGVSQTSRGVSPNNGKVVMAGSCHYCSSCRSPSQKRERDIFGCDKSLTRVPATVTTIYSTIGVSKATHTHTLARDRRLYNSFS